MIPTNIQDYVKIYDNFVESDVCDAAVASLEHANWNVHKFWDPLTEKYIVHEKELSVTFEDIEQSVKIKERMWYAIERYIMKDFSNFNQWFPGWQGFSHLKFNKYDTSTMMTNHCDHIRTIFDGERKGIPILSVILALNDNYNGGEFYMWNDVRITLPKGSILVFPSNFMYPHRVAEVTNGIRYSCISWVF
jgi:predicted 2-oxoglutarate/Fe(II)-dependent dioxygenase YbiX